ncbi:hypothetical protein RRG08_055734 [Elysia crispata]|uniref:Uncharacterized protein n=1 Tax=Elysia crispata TaxID=231223 RepID=A0AAE1B0A3_9GAST|nr:hypothetical protein RRG08_055734 [Elysia crispata]
MTSHVYTCMHVPKFHLPALLYQAMNKLPTSTDPPSVLVGTSHEQATYKHRPPSVLVAISHERATYKRRSPRLGRYQP